MQPARRNKTSNYGANSQRYRELDSETHCRDKFSEGGYCSDSQNLKAPLLKRSDGFVGRIAVGDENVEL